MLIPCLLLYCFASTLAKARSRSVFIGTDPSLDLYKCLGKVRCPFIGDATFLAEEDLGLFALEGNFFSLWAFYIFGRRLHLKVQINLKNLDVCRCYI